MDGVPYPKISLEPIVHLAVAVLAAENHKMDGPCQSFIIQELRIAQELFV